MSFSIQAKRDTLPDVLKLLQQVLREPALPADEFEVMKRERLAGLEQMKTEPAMLAPRLLQRQLNPYPKEDIRYMPTIEESIERLKAATYEQVAQLYRDYLGSQAGELTYRGRLRRGRLPPDPQRHAGWLEGSQALRSHRLAPDQPKSPARSTRSTRPTRPTPRLPPACCSRCATTIRIIPRW